jgi:hypothetical protein
MIARIRLALEGFYRFTEQPLVLASRPALVALLIPLAIGLVQPLWRLEVSGPELVAPLRLEIHASGVSSGHGGADLVRLNALHQAVGMRPIDAATLDELGWLPFGFGILALLALRVAVLGNVRMLVDLAVIEVFFCLFSLLRFEHHLYAMGHRLSQDSAVHVEPFTPVMIGSQEVGGVMVRAGPGIGALCVGVFVVGTAALALGHLVHGRRRFGAARVAEAAR